MAYERHLEYSYNFESYIYENISLYELPYMQQYNKISTF